MNKKINEKNHSSVKTGSVGNNGLLPHAKLLLFKLFRTLTLNYLR